MNIYGDKFQKHSDVCEQCRNHPSDLCPTGLAALLESMSDEVENLNDFSNKFQDHSDVCEQCRRHPFDLCPTGFSALLESIPQHINSLALDSELVMHHSNADSDRLAADMTELAYRFRGSLLGALLGDVIGAVVEAESPGYIRNAYGSVEDILAETEIPEALGNPPWRVGRYTDDTQMMISVAEWLIEDESLSSRDLLQRFSQACDPSRRYGPGTEAILRKFPANEEQWQSLSRMSFPQGSYGNGSAMRVAPVGLCFHRDFDGLASASAASSRPTHCHPLAYQGALLQSSAVAAAVRMEKIDENLFLRALRIGLARHAADKGQDTTVFWEALDVVEDGIRTGTAIDEMARRLGTGTAALKSVPMALFCFLANSDSYADTIQAAVFAGGDTDTIAAMAGAIAGAHLGEQAIPSHWLAEVREDKHGPDWFRELASRLFHRFTTDN
ncbi:ADP-ribosylglycohydrolase family protein [Desulfococcaceae bacterium HSG9]|nr:ADP-ribosylglycohydrolase family protein [Desulfococcaceae bacterium HSG9]